MKLRSKILCLFVAISVLATGGITVYSALEQRSQHIQNELAGQRQLVRLLSNSLLGQYFAYINQQIISVLNTRSELREQSQILTHYLQNYAPTEEEIVKFLRGQQDSFNHVGKDLLLFKNDELLIAPRNSAVFKTVSIGGQTLLSSLRVSRLQTQDGYFLVLFADDHRQGNYLSFIRSLGPDSPYYVCLLQNIDELLAYYAADSRSILPQLTESFDVMKHNLSGTAAIVAAQDHRVILATGGDAMRTLPELNLRELFSTETLGQNVELISSEGVKYYACAAYFKPLDWYIVIYRDEMSVIAPALSQAGVSLVIGLGVLILAVLMAFLLSGRLTRTLNQIS